VPWLGLPHALEILLAIALVAIGLLLIALVVKLLVLLLPAALVALVVWLLTYDRLLTALAFLAVALVSLLKRL
jgi:hypothetical protein